MFSINYRQNTSISWLLNRADVTTNTPSSKQKHRPLYQYILTPVTQPNSPRNPRAFSTGGAHRIGIQKISLVVEGGGNIPYLGINGIPWYSCAFLPITRFLQQVVISRSHSRPSLLFLINAMYLTSYFSLGHSSGQLTN